MSAKFIFITMLLPNILGLVSTFAEAADLHITGRVIAASCTINGFSGGGQNINLGDLGRSQLQNSNHGGGWTSFTLTLSNCPTGTNQASVTFTGIPDSRDPSLYANTEQAETAATGVSIQLVKDNDHSIILSSASTMSVDVDDITRTASFPLAARLYTLQGGVQAGRVSSSVIVNFTYQ